VDVPTPKKPDELMRIDSTPPSAKAIVSAAGNHKPVFRSPVVEIDGRRAVPALNWPTPDRVKPVKVGLSPVPRPRVVL
jgi:hypothetical protein